MRIRSLRALVEKSYRFLPLALANSWAELQRETKGVQDLEIHDGGVEVPEEAA
jgi:hypothetical protein